MVLKNPCWKVSILPEENKRNRILSVDAFEHLVKELPEHAVPIVYLAYYTGMRKQEILRLNWKNVNLQEGYIDLDPADTKNSESRRIYFNDVFREIFQKAGKIRSLCQDFVFTYKSRPIKEIRSGFEEALRRAKIENSCFHDVRHTFNTNVRKAKVDHTVIMNLTGHKTPSMFNRYNTVDRQDAIDPMMIRLNLFLSEQKSFKSSDGHSR